MKIRTCCFSGHRVIEKSKLSSIEEKIGEEIEKLRKKGIKRFISGGALGFDQIAAKVVLEKKADMDDIKLIFVLPCTNQAERWSEKQREYYEKLLKKADEIIYTADEYNEYCMEARNMYIIDASCVCICYLKNQRGGTFNTIKYAIKSDIDVINIAGEI